MNWLCATSLHVIEAGAYKIPHLADCGIKLRIWILRPAPIFGMEELTVQVWSRDSDYFRFYDMNSPEIMGIKSSNS